VSDEAAETVMDPVSFGSARVDADPGATTAIDTASAAPIVRTLPIDFRTPTSGSERDFV
jgi:hypothetical protein